MFALLPVAIVLGLQAKPPRDSLAAAWPNLHWSVAERGPLLLVDGAAHHRLVYQERPYDPFSHRNGNLTEEDEDEPPPSLPPPPRGGYNLGSLLPEFGSEVVRFPTISVIAPSRTYQFAPPRNSTNRQKIREGLVADDEGGGQQVLAYSLLASLTPTQWAEVGSETGLALSQLGPEQREKLLACSLSSLFLHFPPTVQPPTWLRTEEPPFLPDALRQELRLVLRRGLDGLPRPKTKDNIVEVRVREDTPDETREQVETALTGYALLPNRRRDTQLPGTSPALQIPIALTDAPTVGDIVARIAKASHLPLVADVTIQSTPLQVRGSRALAGDTLAALCQALGATVRRIEEMGKVAYLLTDSVETEAQRAAQMLPEQVAVEIEYAQLIRQRDQEEITLWKTLSTEPALFRLPKGIGKEYPDAIWNHTEDTLPVSTLSVEFQDQLTAPYERAKVASPKTVRVRDVIEVALYSPSLNATATLATPTRPKIVPPLPLLTLPTDLPTRALLTRLPTDSEQSDKFLAQVKAFGFTELRIPVTLGEANERALATFGTAAKTANLGLVPVMSVLNATAPSQDRERSPLGKTFQEWLASPISQMFIGFVGHKRLRFETQTDIMTPEAADTHTIAETLKRLSLLPGVTGIGLTDLAAPGYRTPYTADSMDRYSLFSFSDNRWRARGLPGQRVAFVLQHHADPDDLDVGVRRQGAVLPTWNRLQAARRDTFLLRLATEIKAEKIVVPITAQNGVSGSWSPWNGHYPKLTPESMGFEAVSYGDYRTSAFEMPSGVEWLARGEPEPFRRYLRAALKRLHTGVLLDLDPLPLDEALTVLSSSLQPQEVKK